MPRLNRRHKVISIRISGEEFDQLQNICVTKGADSISELARRAMRLFITQENKYDTAAIESRVNEMNLRISALDQEVARLSRLVVATLENAARPQGNGGQRYATSGE